MSRTTALALLILLLATAVRFHALGRQSFWNDEGNTARLSERSVQLIIEGTASDIHPPLYYLILSGWQKLLGTTEFALRAFSAFVGLLIVAVTMRLGWEMAGQKDLAGLADLLGRRGDNLVGLPRPARFLTIPDSKLVGLVAGLFTAISPPLLYYSQEARMYSLLGLLAVASICLLVQRVGATLVVAPPAGQPRRLPLQTIAYTLLLTAGLYTHYFFPAIIAVLAVSYWLLAFSQSASQPVSQSKIQNPKSKIPPFLLPLALALLLYAPWLPIFWRSTGGGGTASGIGLWAWGQQVWSWLLSGPLLASGGWVAATAILLALIGSWRAGLLWIWLILPVLFMFGVGSTQPQHLKFLTAVVPALALLWGRGTAVLWRTGWAGQGAAILLVAILLANQALAWRELTTNPAHFRADYRGMAADITAEAHPNAAVILNAPNQWEVFTYYYQGTAAVYPFPRFAAPPEELIPELERMAAEHGRIYALFWGEAGFDPQRTVESWLDANAFKAREEWRGDVRFVSYAVPPQTGDEMGTPLGYPVGQAITLVGYTLPQTAARPGDILPLTLFWETAAPIPERYKVFVHLLNVEGALVAQRDGEPVGNLRPTTTWPVGETILDKHGLFLPADLPAGDYALLVGLYDLSDPSRRLEIITAEGIVNALSLGVVTVE